MLACSKYQQFLGIPYTDGDHDCYGLLRRYYAENYGLRLRNYARPLDFASHVDLISSNFVREGFEIIDTPLSQLSIGDGVLMCLNNRKFVNHVGAFVGNGYLLHHLYKRLSSVDALTPVWLNRIVSVVRHPEVTEQNVVVQPEINFMDLLPAHLKAKYEPA